MIRRKGTPVGSNQKQGDTKMKRRGFVVIALLGSLLFIPSCANNFIPPTDPVALAAWISKNKTTIEDVISTAAEYGTQKGLQQWAKTDPAGATEAAKDLSQNITNDILPYFKDGSKMLTAAEVKQLLASSLFKKVPPIVKTAIVAASAVLDYYCPIPDSGSYLTQDQKEIVCSFFTGIQAGCNDFIPPATGTKAVKSKARSMPKKAWID